MKPPLLFCVLLCFGFMVGPAADAYAQTPAPKLQYRIAALHLPAPAALPAALLFISRQPKCSLFTWWAEWNRAQEGIRNRKDSDVLLLQVWLGVPPALR